MKVQQEKNSPQELIQMKRITSLELGEKVTVALHSNSGNDPWMVDCTFIDVTGTGDDARAFFTDGDTVEGTPWELYRYNGGWVWGSSCDRASLVALR
jgi:hypothetical protein